MFRMYHTDVLRGVPASGVRLSQLATSYIWYLECIYRVYLDLPHLYCTRTPSMCLGRFQIISPLRNYCGLSFLSFPRTSLRPPHPTKLCFWSTVLYRTEDIIFVVIFKWHCRECDTESVPLGLLLHFVLGQLDIPGVNKQTADVRCHRLSIQYCIYDRSVLMNEVIVYDWLAFLLSLQRLQQWVPVNFFLWGARRIIVRI